MLFKEIHNKKIIMRGDRNENKHRIDEIKELKSSDEKTEVTTTTVGMNSFKLEF